MLKNPSFIHSTLCAILKTVDAKFSFHPGWLASCNTGLKVISVNRASSANRASPAHVIGPLNVIRTSSAELNDLNVISESFVLL